MKSGSYKLDEALLSPTASLVAFDHAFGELLRAPLPKEEEEMKIMATREHSANPRGRPRSYAYHRCGYKKRG